MYIHQQHEKYIQQYVLEQQHILSPKRKMLRTHNFLTQTYSSREREREIERERDQHTTTIVQLSLPARGYQL